jgi:hypothetical protein
MKYILFNIITGLTLTILLCGCPMCDMSDPVDIMFVNNKSNRIIGVGIGLEYPDTIINDQKLTNYSLISPYSIRSIQSYHYTIEDFFEFNEVLQVFIFKFDIGNDLRPSEKTLLAYYEFTYEELRNHDWIVVYPEE